MKIVFVFLESDSGREAREQVFKALGALGYDGRYIETISFDPVIGVRVHNVSAHQEPTEEQIEELEALSAVKEVVTMCEAPRPEVAAPPFCSLSGGERMLQVLKYAVPTSTSGFTIDLPEGAQILSAQVQEDQPRIWVLVDPDRQTETRRFLMVETGAYFSVSELTELRFISTLLSHDGCYVLHLFEMDRDVAP